MPPPPPPTPPGPLTPTSMNAFLVCLTMSCSRSNSLLRRLVYDVPYTAELSSDAGGAACCGCWVEEEEEGRGRGLEEVGRISWGSVVRGMSGWGAEEWPRPLDGSLPSAWEPVEEAAAEEEAEVEVGAALRGLRWETRSRSRRTSVRRGRGTGGGTGSEGVQVRRGLRGSSRAAVGGRGGERSTFLTRGVAPHPARVSGGGGQARSRWQRGRGAVLRRHACAREAVSQCCCCI